MKKTFLITLQEVFKNKARLYDKFYFKNFIPKDLTSVVVYKLQCGLCNEFYWDEWVRHLNLRTGEHVCMSPLTKK